MISEMPFVRSLITPIKLFYDMFLFQNLQDVTAAEFKLFIDFLKSLTLFGQNATVERVQELVEIIEGQADLDAQFNVCSISCTGKLVFICFPLVDWLLPSLLKAYI